MEKRRKLFIGTSGWIYKDWDGVFYPNDLPSEDKIKYFSKHFKTVEVNYSFYHLPRSTTFQKWYSETLPGFVFAVKASRLITHIKRLKGVKKIWKQFLKNTLYLKEKLGPILFQFPPSFSATGEDIKRLEDFLKILRDLTSINLKYAFEFRHKSWCDEKIYQLLKKYNMAWVIADSPFYPKAEVITADFVYIRMHGSQILFASKYNGEELEEMALKIKKWLKNCDVYVYFNNDAHGYAVENAKELLKFCKE